MAIKKCRITQLVAFLFANQRWRMIFICLPQDNYPCDLKLGNSLIIRWCQGNFRTKNA